MEPQDEIGMGHPLMYGDLHGHEYQDAPSKLDNRKSNKPIMEKKRRARINTCLNELKSLILEALNKDASRHSKLEKADILEMTVKHLQVVQRQQLGMAVAKEPPVLQKFKDGFNECAREISRYVSRIDGVDMGVRHRLLQHLTRTTTNLNNTSPAAFACMAGVPVAPVIPGIPPANLSPEDANNNHSRFIHRLIAARLAASGDTTGAALLLQGGLPPVDRRSMDNIRSHVPLKPTEPISTPLPMKLKPDLGLAPSVNQGASSSREFSSRLSAFTAVKRSKSPPRIDERIHQETISPKIITPTVVRVLPRPQSEPKTLVQAHVSLKPVDRMSPDSFSFKKENLKRPLEESDSYPRPAKQMIRENPVLHRPEAIAMNFNIANLVRPKSPIVPQDGSRNESQIEEEERDMWRPW